MRTRTLAILIVILAILAGVGTLIIRQKAPERSQGRLGKYLFEQLPANKIASITIKGPDEAVSLAKKADRWVVEERFDYRADFQKISGFVRELKQAKTGREFESSEDTLKRLSLKNPDDPEAREQEKGTQILLKDHGGTLVTSLLLGKTRKSGHERSFPDGRYVKLSQDPTIYLIDRHFASLEKDPSAWLEKTLVKVGANEVKKISCLGADSKKARYSFVRPEKGKDLEPVDLPADRKVKKSALNRLAGALSSLRMEDVAKHLDGPESGGVEFSCRLEYHLFNGMVYRVYPGGACSEAGKCHLRLEVDYQEPPPEKKEITEDESPKSKGEGPEKTPEEQALEARQLNEHLSPWVYVIPNRKHSVFMMDLDGLLEKPEKKGTES